MLETSRNNALGMALLLLLLLPPLTMLLPSTVCSMRPQ
jgi:hypothetical protein